MGPRFHLMGVQSCLDLARISWLCCVLTLPAWAVRGEAQTSTKQSLPGAEAARVYGEWRIRVKPDQGQTYQRLIEKSGLPLFREAGGRMVGWWKTLVGDLYEHVTIWEYDDMAAFERAGQFLSRNPAFARFVASRDPLLAGEESRFLRLATGGARPQVPDPSPLVVHETHRVPLTRREAYLEFMTRQGFERLRSHGFRPVGPWVVNVGRWSEVTYLFQFESLAQREQLLARFSATAQGRTFGQQLNEFAREVTTRVLIPAPFAHPAPSGEATPKPAATAPPLPHREQLAPGVHVAGFSDRFGSANCGWIALGEETLLIDMPRGIPPPVPQPGGRNDRQGRTKTRFDARATWRRAHPPVISEGRNHARSGVARSPVSAACIPGHHRSRAAARPARSNDGGRRLTAGSSFSRSMQPPAEPVRWFTFRVARCFSPGPWSSTARAASYPAATQRPGSPRCAGWRSSGPSMSFPASARGAARSRIVRQRRFLAELRRQVGYQISRAGPAPISWNRFAFPPMTWSGCRMTIRPRRTSSMCTVR